MPSARCGLPPVFGRERAWVTCSQQVNTCQPASASKPHVVSGGGPGACANNLSQVAQGVRKPRPRPCFLGVKELGSHVHNKSTPASPLQPAILLFSAVEDRARAQITCPKFCRACANQGPTPVFGRES